MNFSKINSNCMALQAAINDHKVHAHLRSILLYAKKRMIYYCNHLSEIFLK